MLTLLAAAGVPDVKEKLAPKKGYRANGKKFRVHLDGRCDNIKVDFLWML